MLLMLDLGRTGKGVRNSLKSRIVFYQGAVGPPKESAFRVYSMKKAITLLGILLGVAAGVFAFMRTAPQQTTFNTARVDRADGTPSADQAPTQGEPGKSNEKTNPSRAGGSATEGLEVVDDVKPATEAYTSAEEALAAALKGSKDFDDSILEQFTEPSADCSWCPAFYNSIQELVTNPNTPQDQKSYLAELLAISGRPENVQVLVDSIKNARSSGEADVYAEALELTLGKDDVTKVLSEQLTTTNDTLREASVAAITNQGSRTAAEILQQHIQARNDPDAYYSQGTGPGEFIPDEEAMPAVQDYVALRDKYSDKWALSLINAGLPGLQVLFQQLENSNNPEADRYLIKGAIEHVNFEDGIKELAETVIANNKSPVAVDLAKQIRDEVATQESDEASGTTQQ